MPSLQSCIVVISLYIHDGNTLVSLITWIQFNNVLCCGGVYSMDTYYYTVSYWLALFVQNFCLCNVYLYGNSQDA